VILPFVVVTGGERPQVLGSSPDEMGGERMAGQGSTGNVIAALASFFVPGLGQLIQGRIGMALVQFVLGGLLWIVLLGWAVHLWSIVDAALWKGPRRAGG
jgi:TM2 domain-containing membrane protein YozV